MAAPAGVLGAGANVGVVARPEHAHRGCLGLLVCHRLSSPTILPAWHRPGLLSGAETEESISGEGLQGSGNVGHQRQL